MKLFLMILLLSGNLFAWGPEGHMIVAQIAEDQLSPRAKTTVAQLLGGQSMASVSNWADTIKEDPQWAKSKPWHYVNIPDGQTYETSAHDPQGDVVTAITQMVSILANRSSFVTDRQVALKFIIHFMGDIHQPLHAGRANDQGGNSIKVVFDGKALNLHSLWDSGMIVKQQMDYLQYTHYLETQSFLNPTLPNIPFDQIIAEDMQARNAIYSFPPVTLDTAVQLDDRYMNANLKLMNSRLFLGGKRLAMLLNSIL